MPEPIENRIETPDTRASFASPPTTPPDEPTLTQDPALVVPAGYVIVGEIARGGMGVVYRADDSALNRPVALKYLQEKYASHGPAVARFLYEAKVTARLQHPGIPPIHAVGTLSDGRPFLAMKLIQGRTLGELLREQGPGAGRWLGVFESICQALAYAHSEGVIHRDLKPANVMVGAFGEVQVMDWGLAKWLADWPSGEPSDDALATTAESAEAVSDRAETAAGTVLGTPAFMPPEQAIGAIDKLDRRSDVFGLGAILCTLLTGKPPFVGTDGESTRQLAATAKLADAFARLDACGAEPELVALAKRCLAAEQGERPADAGALADEVAKLRQAAEDRARQAEMETVRVEERAEREKQQACLKGEEEGRRRRLVRLAAGVVFGVLLLGLAGTTAGAFVANDYRLKEKTQRGVAETKRGEAEQAQAEAETARGVAENRRVEAETARDLARRRFRLALDTFHHVVINVQNKLETRVGTQELSRELLQNAKQELVKLRQEAQRQGSPDHTLVWAYLRMGDVEMVLGNTPAALKEYQAGYDLARRLADADSKNVQAQRDLSASLDRLGDVMLRLGQTKEALEHHSKCREILQRLADADGKDASVQRNYSVSLNKLGDLMLRLGQTKEALEHYTKSLEIDQRLADADPNNVQAQRDLSISLINLGDVMLRLGQTKKALAHFGKSLQVSQRLADADPKDAQTQRALSLSLERLGGVMLRLGQTKEALAHYSKCREISQRLADADPNNVQAQRDLSLSLNKLGGVMLRLGKTKEAREHHSKSLAIDNRLADSDPKDARTQRALIVSLDNLGGVMLRLGQTKEALAHYSKCREISQRLADADPNNAQAQRDLSLSLERLGGVMLRLGQTKEALGHSTKSLEVRQRLADADAKDAQAQRDLGASLNNVGNVMLRLNKTKEALEHYTKSLQVSQRLADADPNNVQAQMDLFISYWNLGRAEKAQHDYARASEWFATGRAVLLPWHEKKLLVGQFKDSVARVERELAFCKAADQAVTRLNFAFAQPPAQVGPLLDVRVRALLHRRHVGDAIRTAECWRDWAETRDKDRIVERYAAARALALCAAASAQRDVLVGKAVAVLTKLRAAGVFDDEQHRAEFARDADFAGVRDHPAFAAFVRTLAKE